jgi:glycosyltransferase involved in cell wall biosynthesis
MDFLYHTEADNALTGERGSVAQSRPHLVIVGDRGDTGEADHLASLAQQAGVGLEMRWRVTESELRDLYRSAFLFLYAPYLEPLGLVALEAMACGTPVLGVREGGVRETVVPEVSGWLVERDERLLAECLSRLVAQPSEVETLRVSARDYVCREYTWGKSVSHLLELIGQLPK